MLLAKKIFFITITYYYLEKILLKKIKYIKTIVKKHFANRLQVKLPNKIIQV